jgi:hypothetical protein
MGILVGVAKILCELSVKHAFKGKLATLGKQNIIITPEQWSPMRSCCPSGMGVTLETERHLRWNTDFISSNYFFRSLGFSEVCSIDVSAYEAATYICDLNSPELPSELHGQFDVVFDGSTIEHIFHLPNVLSNIFRMLKVGGKVLHMSPSNHFMDDGFYQLSPTFFVDYYRENRFQTDFALLHFMKVSVHDQHGQKRIETQDRVIPYDPNDMAKISAAFGTHGDELCQTLFMATKTAQATGGRIPLQSRYSSKSYWQENLSGAGQRQRGNQK